MQRQLYAVILTPRLTGLPAAVPAALLILMTLLSGVPLAASWALDGPPEATAVVGPKVVVPEPIEDFGDVAKGTRLSHDFVLRNAGTETLEISRVVPACGCTATEFDREIAPGGEGKIRALVDTRSMSGPTERTLTVYTNDPASPRLTLGFKAIVKPYLSSRPGFARYQTVHGEPPPPVAVQTVWAEDGSDFEILGIESPYPFLTATFHPAGEGEGDAGATGRRWLVELELHSDEAPIGPLAQELVVHTNHPVQKDLRIPITGFVRPPILTIPRQVELGKVDLTERSKFVVIVQNLRSEPIEVTGVESSSAGLEPAYSPLQEGRKFAVEVVLAPDLPKGPFEATLQIRTSSAEMPVVEVPVRGTIL